MTFLIRFGVWQVDKWVRCVDYIRQPQVHLKVIIEKSHGFQNFHTFFDTSKCTANYVISFEIYI